MNDIVLIVSNIAVVIAFVFFIRCENKNTKVCKEQLKELKKQNKMLDEIKKAGRLECKK